MLVGVSMAEQCHNFNSRYLISAVTKIYKEVTIWIAVVMFLVEKKFVQTLSRIFVYLKFIGKCL